MLHFFLAFLILRSFWSCLSCLGNALLVAKSVKCFCIFNKRIQTMLSKIRKLNCICIFIYWWINFLSLISNIFLMVSIADSLICKRIFGSHGLVCETTIQVEFHNKICNFCDMSNFFKVNLIINNLKLQSNLLVV